MILPIIVYFNFQIHFISIFPSPFLPQTPNLSRDLKSRLYRSISPTLFGQSWSPYQYFLHSLCLEKHDLIIICVFYRFCEVYAEDRVDISMCFLDDHGGRDRREEVDARGWLGESDRLDINIVWTDSKIIYYSKSSSQNSLWVLGRSIACDIGRTHNHQPPSSYSLFLLAHLVSAFIPTLLDFLIFHNSYFNLFISLSIFLYLGTQPYQTYILVLSPQYK